MITDPLAGVAVMFPERCRCRVCWCWTAVDHMVKRRRKSRSGLSLYFVRVCRRCHAVEAQ